MKNNPSIFEHKGGPIVESRPDEEPGWYFWDEVWLNYYGPYDHEMDCVKAMSDYARNL